jgi:nuclear pore complex protein Nup93
MIREVVLASGAYAELLGDIRADGTKVVSSSSLLLRPNSAASEHPFLIECNCSCCFYFFALIQPGAIERSIKLAHIPDERTYLLSIVKVAASRSSSSSSSNTSTANIPSLTSSIILYNLAEDYDTVVHLLSTALGASLALPSSASSSSAGGGASSSAGFGGEEDIGNLARGILDHYQSDMGKWARVGEKNRETCRVLLRLKQGLGLVEEGRLEKALEVRLDLT